MPVFLIITARGHRILVNSWCSCQAECKRFELVHLVSNKISENLGVQHLEISINLSHKVVLLQYIFQAANALHFGVHEGLPGKHSGTLGSLWVSSPILFGDSEHLCVGCVSYCVFSEQTLNPLVQNL